jgi:hypothetical protein
MNKERRIVISVVIALITITSVVVYYYYVQSISSPSHPSVIKHVFKAREIYPTKQGGREWFIDMANPISDKYLTHSLQ